MKKVSLNIILILALVLSISTVVFAQESSLEVPESVVEQINADKSGVDTYIVLMQAKPIVAYEGDLAGFPATKPGKGGKVNPNSAHVKKYEKHLEANQNAALSSVGASSDDKLYSYTYSVSGFAADLSAGQAAQLELQEDVMLVQLDEIRYIQTDNSPDFLGLSDPAGPWAKGYDGEGVVVGVIDSGIWPEHPSFADDGSYGLPPDSFTGTGCDFGNTSFNPDDAPFTCNNKLLAAKTYGLGYHGGTGAGLAPGSYNSARDEDGHGSHTSSTAAGNAGVSASILGSDLGAVSGIAPRARISMYKACWSDTPTTGGCNVTDLVAAIDQAVADGVDVINYSIGSPAASIGPDDVSFLFAADAGVFVATSAGNEGPGAATTGSPSTAPWVTGVGASTQDRTFQGSALLGDGNEFFGASVTGGTAMLSLVDAADAGDELCNPGALDSGVVAGNIVLCKRGAIARVSKSQAVAMAGGTGMILYNANDGQSQSTDNHYVPSVHISNTDGLTILDYINTAGSEATAQIIAGAFAPIPAPWMGSFSSRGPNRLSMDIIKPDVTAPGVNILAANSPTALLGSPGEYFQSIGGTSMASPHVTGTFALLKQAHPDWSAAMAKSALMTTTYQDVMKEDGVTAADPFDMGAGHIDPGDKANKGSIMQPGLAYDAGLFEYAAFTCGADLGVFSPGSCDFLEAIGIPSDPSDLNLASIGVAELVGSQTIVRTVTSVASENGWRDYTVSVDVPPGFDVTVSPSSFSLKAGDSVTYEVTITNDGSAVLGQWSFGSLTWNDATGHYDVYSPIAVRAFELAAQSEIHFAGTDGSGSFDVSFGYDGNYVAGSHGLNPADMQAGTVDDDPANDINAALGTCDFSTFPYDCVGITWHGFTVPAGAVYARFSLFDEYTDGADDLDLYVWGPSGGLVGGSGSGTSAEEVNAFLPEAGFYEIAVHGWGTDGPDTNYTLFNWATGADLGNMTVTAPTSAVSGTVEPINVTWTGLSLDTKYLGAVSHSNGSDILGLTVIRVDTD